jgi:hypothetical protein
VQVSSYLLELCTCIRDSAYKKMTFGVYLVLHNHIGCVSHLYSCEGHL